MSKDKYFNTDHLRSTLRTQALKGASFTVGTSSLIFIIQTAGMIIMARLLSPNDFGLVTMVLAISLLLQNFGVNGFTEAIIQKEDINHKQISTLFWINVSLSFVIAVLFIAVSPIITWYYKEPRLTSIIIVISSTFVFTGLSTQHLAILKRNMQFKKLAINDISASLIGNIIPIFLAWRGWGYWALVAKWVIWPLSTTVGAWIFCGWWPGLPARNSGVRPLIKYAIHVYGNFAMSYLRRNLDKILIGRYFGTQQLGYYDRSYHLSSMLPTQIVGPLNNVALSTFSRLADDPAKYRHHYLQVISILAFIGMPLSAALSLSSADVILLLLGPQWHEAGRIFLAFGLSIGVMVIYITHGWLHLSLGTPDRWFRWSIMEFIVTVLCFVIGLPFGAFGIAVAFTVSFYILLCPALWYAGKPIKLKVSSVLSNLWRYYLAALLSGFLCWFILHSCEMSFTIFTKLHILIRITISVILCISFYLVIVITLFRSITPISQFISILREIIHNRSAS